jgi:hypothetical protein
LAVGKSRNSPAPERLVVEELVDFFLGVDMLNLMDVISGQVIELKDGSTLNVVENVGDGIWLKVLDASGGEDLVFCEDIARVLEN